MKDNIDFAEEKIKEALNLITGYCNCKGCYQECRAFKAKQYLRKTLKLFPKG